VLVLPLLVLSVLLLFTSHVAANPISVTTLSEVKSTCKYPVDDVYSALGTTEPDRYASCVFVPQDDDVHELMVTKS
jgi:hypothetical protein